MQSSAAWLASWVAVPVAGSQTKWRSTQRKVSRLSSVSAAAGSSTRTIRSAQSARARSSASWLQHASCAVIAFA